MAKLKLIGTDFETENLADVKKYLESENIQFGTFALTTFAKELAQQKEADEIAREKLLAEYDYIAEKYKNLADFRQDVVFLHPGFPHYPQLLKLFGDIHYHYENEYWYFFGGEYDFGFLGNDGRKFYVTVSAGEYLTVPEGKWQWLNGTVDHEMKAMRFFNCSGKMIKPNNHSPFMN